MLCLTFRNNVGERLVLIIDMSHLCHYCHTGRHGHFELFFIPGIYTGRVDLIEVDIAIQQYTEYSLLKWQMSLYNSPILKPSFELTDVTQIFFVKPKFTT
jgi:hypothetical protein